MGRVSRAYVVEKLRLVPEAGVAIDDEFWIALAGQLIKAGTPPQKGTKARAREKTAPGSGINGCCLVHPTACFE